jgi:hypothetical protein
MIHFQGYKQGTFDDTGVYMNVQEAHVFFNGGTRVWGADAHQKNDTVLTPKKPPRCCLEGMQYIKHR